MDNDHVGDLDDGILVGLGEDALAAGALDVEGEDAEGRHLGPVALGGVGDQPVPGHVNFHLYNKKTSGNGLLKGLSHEID